MRGYLAFSKKEFMENLRNYRFFSIFAIFLIFGFLSPLLAKLTPDLLAAFAPDLVLFSTAPTALDAWEQFYKNISGLGMSIMLIIFCNLLSSEYQKGTLNVLFTKGLSRTTVILSKFSIAAAIMTISYWVSFFICDSYTKYFWPDLNLSNIIFAAFALWLVGIMYLSILILGCVLFKPAFSSIFFLLSCTVIMTLLSLPSQFTSYSPTILLTKNLDLLSGTATIGQFTIPILLTLFLSIICLSTAIVLFRQKQI